MVGTKYAKTSSGTTRKMRPSFGWRAALNRIARTPKRIASTARGDSTSGASARASALGSVSSCRTNKSGRIPHRAVSLRRLNEISIEGPTIPVPTRKPSRTGRTGRRVVGSAGCADPRSSSVAQARTTASAVDAFEDVLAGRRACWEEGLVGGRLGGRKAWWEEGVVGRAPRGGASAVAAVQTPVRVRRVEPERY